MNYEIDQCYDFEVLPPDTPQDDYFKLSVMSNSGPAVVRLPKIAFQKIPGRPRPDKLNCRVKSINEDGVPMLTHVVGPYVYELYKSTFERGGGFECEVISVPSNTAEEPFMVSDRYGIFYRLNEPEGLLAKGQIIRCKFTKLTPRYFTLMRIDEGAKLPYYSPAFLFDAISMPGAMRMFINKVVLTLPELDGVLREISSKQPRWVLNFARIVLKHMSEWLVASKVQRRGHLYRRLIGYMREALLFLLEGSSYLNAVPAEERRSLQTQFTELVESLQPFDRMVELVTGGDQDEFVEGLFDKLQKSGYLYHPAKQFAVLMLIFRLQPDKVVYYLSRIFESIFSRDLENWKREPFRSAFVEQFKIYVSLARREIDALPMAETREQKSRLETIITAIALQLLLSDPKDNASRTESLFFRYISLLRPLNTEALLSKSFMALMGAEMATKLNYMQLRQPMMMMTQATIMPPGDFMSHISVGHRYSNGLVDVAISSNGIVISATNSRPNADRVIPEKMMTWLKPQVYLDGVPGLSGSRMKKLSEHDHWWTFIENGLFERKTAAPASVIEVARPKRHAEKGDEVYIVIDSVDNYFDSNPIFNCHIEDTDFTDGKGILKRDMIIGYNLKQPSEMSYKAPDGSQYGFLAKVIDTRPDGSYVFSLRDEVDRFLEDAISFENEYLAVITGTNERDYSAIARDGFGLFLSKDYPQACKAGDIVRFRINQKGKQGSVRGYITEISSNPEDKFDKTAAFVNLMEGIGVIGSAEEQSQENEDMIRDIDEILLPEDIREVIEIIRFSAIAESELIKAYDYLRFARLLALSIGDKTLADKLSTHAALLTLHQYYATNNRIDPERLEKLQTAAESDLVLRMIYHRLELVSWLDRPERNNEIYASVCDPGSEIEASIARMVLSYNMIHTENVPDNDIASNIKTKIMEKLNVNSETRRGKYYGSESKYLEFKTSIVYPAITPGAVMREDPSAQQFHILSRIAGMLNANGGRLYIGVNNDGYEVGMHDDFKYFERRRAVCGSHQFKITDVDSMCVFLENLVDMTFGPTIARKITIGPDEEAEKEVILINVEESLEPVYLDGRLFVRQSGQSTREYHGKVEADFVRERAELLAERQHLLTIAQSADIEEKMTRADEVEDENVTVATESTALVPLADTDTETTADVILTSGWRPNVLHDYESGFTEVAGYIYFTTDKKILFSKNDLYKETGIDDCSLALALPHDMVDEYLVMGFDGDRALKVPVREIMEKAEGSGIPYYSDSELMFASLANRNDALICILTDGSGTLWRRGIMLSQMDNSHASSEPRRVHDAISSSTAGWEIAASSAIPHIADCLDSNLAARRIGVTMKIRQNTPAYREKMDELVNQCRDINI